MKLKTKWTGILDIPEGKSGDFEIKHRTFPAGHVFDLATSRTAIIGGHKPARLRFEFESRWHTLLENGGVWMTDLPIEQYQIDTEVKAIKTGRVLIGGLGLGYVATVLAQRPRIREVVVIEQSSDVIKLVAPYLLNASGAKLRIEHGDLFAYLNALPEGRYAFDHAFYDIWTSDGEGTFFDVVVPLLQLSRRRVRREPVNWNESVMRGQLFHSLTSRYYVGVVAPPEFRAGMRGVLTLDQLCERIDDKWIDWSVPFFQWVKQASPTQKEVEDKAALYAALYGRRVFEILWELKSGITIPKEVVS